MDHGRYTESDVRRIMTQAQTGDMDVRLRELKPFVTVVYGSAESGTRLKLLSRKSDLGE